MSTFHSRLNIIAKNTNSYLKSYFARQETDSYLLQPIKYGVFSGGKRFRSAIVVNAGKIFNIDSFETSGEITVYVAKEINSSEGLYFKANYDMLSKLPNRNLLNDRFNLLLSQSKRTNSKIAVLFIDLDGFKKINDNFGHNAGDLVLIEISNRLKKTIRDSDTISRWGGDEFIILLNNVDNKKNINIFADRMIRDCSNPIMINNKTDVSITLSIGISIYPDNGENKIELLELADKAMYKAKKTENLDYLYCK